MSSNSGQSGPELSGSVDAIFVCLWPNLVHLTTLFSLFSTIAQPVRTRYCPRISARTLGIKLISLFCATVFDFVMILDNLFLYFASPPVTLTDFAMSGTVKYTTSTSPHPTLPSVMGFTPHPSPPTIRFIANFLIPLFSLGDLLYAKTLYFCLPFLFASYKVTVGILSLVADLSIVAGFCVPCFVVAINMYTENKVFGHLYLPVTTYVFTVLESTISDKSVLTSQLTPPLGRVLTSFLAPPTRDINFCLMLFCKKLVTCQQLTVLSHTYCCFCARFLVSVATLTVCYDTPTLAVVWAKVLVVPSSFPSFLSPTIVPTLVWILIWFHLVLPVLSLYTNTSKTTTFCIWAPLRKTLKPCRKTVLYMWSCLAMVFALSYHGLTYTPSLACYYARTCLQNDSFPAQFKVPTYSFNPMGTIPSTLWPVLPSVLDVFPSVTPIFLLPQMWFPPTLCRWQPHRYTLAFNSKMAHLAPLGQMQHNKPTLYYSRPPQPMVWQWLPQATTNAPHLLNPPAGCWWHADLECGAPWMVVVKILLHPHLHHKMPLPHLPTYCPTLLGIAPLDTYWSWGWSCIPIPPHRPPLLHHIVVLLGKTVVTKYHD